MDDKQEDGAVPLSIRVIVEPGDPIGGSIRLEGSEDQVAFSGWIELMAAIDNARVAKPL
jgi:hypothetical protein